MEGKIYTVSCTVMDCPIYSGTNGLYSTKKSAVENLIKSAGYTVSDENQLLRYLKPQPDWQSYEDLYNHVSENYILIHRKNDKITEIFFLNVFSGIEQ